MWVAASGNSSKKSAPKAKDLGLTVEPIAKLTKRQNKGLARGLAFLRDERNHRRRRWEEREISDAELLAQIVEVDVTRLPDRLVKIHRSVATRLPASESELLPGPWYRRWEK